ncbi:hypothetical protein Prudu_022997, partial [Prunus dulcis]
PPPPNPRQKIRPMSNLWQSLLTASLFSVGSVDHGAMILLTFIIFLFILTIMRTGVDLVSVQRKKVTRE